MSTATATKQRTSSTVTIEKRLATPKLVKLMGQQVRTAREMAEIEQAIFKATAELQVRYRSLKEEDALIHDAMTNAMAEVVRNGGDKKFENEYLTVTYVAPSTQNRIDTAKLKLELPKVAAKYSKQVATKDFVKITVKGAALLS